jgi:hypothetical protein
MIRTTAVAAKLVAAAEVVAMGPAALEPVAVGTAAPELVATGSAKIQLTIPTIVEAAALCAMAAGRARTASAGAGPEKPYAVAPALRLTRTQIIVGGAASSVMVPIAA